LNHLDAEKRAAARKQHTFDVFANHAADATITRLITLNVGQAGYNA